MGLLKTFRDILSLDEPAKPSAYGADQVSRRVYEKMHELYAEAVRDMREAKMQRDCFAAELKRLGYTHTGLIKRVELYKRNLKAAVRNGVS